MAKKKNISSSSTPQAAKPTFDFVFPTHEIPTFYINNAQFGTSEFDVRIDLGEIVETVQGDDGSVTQVMVHPKVRLFMSMPFATRFTGAMQQQIMEMNRHMRQVVEEMKEKQRANASEL